MCVCGVYLDVDECAVGRTQGGHNCPDFSSCANTVGSFTCICFSGYTLKAKGCDGVSVYTNTATIFISLCIQI